MRIRRCRFRSVLATCLFGMAVPIPVLAVPTPQSTPPNAPPMALPGPPSGPPVAALADPAVPPRSSQAAAAADGWQLTGQVGTGLSFYFGDQATDPAFGFSIGRFVSESMQVEGQLLGLAGPLRERYYEDYTPGGDDEGRTLYSTSLLRVRRQMYLALTRLNIHFGDGRARPYLSFGAGLGWGSEHEERQRTCFSPQCVDYPAGNRDDSDQAIAFATLLGTGVDIAVADRWHVRPEVVMPLLLGAPQGGYVTMALGITYSTAPGRFAGTAAPRARPRAGEPLSSAWRRVAALPLGDLVRVQLRRGSTGLRDGGIEHPESRVLVGTFVAANDDSLVLRVIQGARDGIWRFPRTRVERIERGRLERDGPGAGVLGGFVSGALIGAAWYLGSGGGDDHEVLIPAATVAFGGPAALIGGIADYAYQRFEVTELTYDIRLVVPG